MDECTDSDMKLLCKFAFDAIISTLNDKSLDELVFPEKFKDQSSPLFVTWSIGEEKALRGCVGTFTTNSIEKNLMIYSLTAAFQDTRFKPISIKEVPSLHCGISLLCHFEDGSNGLDWEVGKHGITIEFSTDRSGKHRATFLPEVAKDRNWDKETTLAHLIAKAGYYGELSEVIDKITLKRYQSVKVSLDYDEYIKMKD